MAQGFSASDAAFEGFRLLKDRPRTVAIWGALYLVGMGAVVGAVFALGRGDMSALAGADSAPDFSALLRRLLPVLLVMFPLMIAFLTVLMTAMYRAVIFPDQRGFAYLRIGKDEVRLFLAVLLLSLIWIAFAGSIAALIWGAAVALDGAARGLAIFLLVVIGIVGGIWGGVRLSLVAPTAMAEGRIDLGASWALTRGRFWPLFGAYVLALALALVVSIVGSVLSLIVMAILGGGLVAMGQAENPDFGSFTPLMFVAFAIYVLIQLVSAVLQLVVQTVPPASIYRQLSPRSPAEVFS